MQLGFLFVFRRDEIKQLVPNLVFEEDFGALHFKAAMEEVEGNFLVCLKLLQTIDRELVLQQKLFLDFFDELFG